MPALFIRMSSRSDVAWTAPKTWCGRGALARLLQLGEQPAAAL
jgi:hypothetical protein